MQHQTVTTIGFENYAASRERAIMQAVRSLNELAATWSQAQRVTYREIHTLFNCSDWRCTCCQAKFTPLAPLTAEHVYPLGNTRQGYNRPSNIRIVCDDCKRTAAPKPQRTVERRLKPRGQRPTTSSNMRAVA